MSDFPQPPSPPDPVKIAQWAGQIRTLLALLAGAGLVGGAWAGVSAEQIANWLTAILTVVGLASAAAASIWSWYQKIKDRKVLVASTVASVQKGTPVVVTVTPEGQPNIATRVSATEQKAAPTVPIDLVPQPPPAA